MITIENINQSWNWKNISAVEIINTNDFGNIIFKTLGGEYWRICPEEVSCEKLAVNEEEYQEITSHHEFNEDWEMKKLIEIAKNKLGALDANEKYCLKIPAPIGGEYEVSNLGKIDFVELISFCGDLAQQIESIDDGDKISLEIQN